MGRGTSIFEVPEDGKSLEHLQRKYSLVVREGMQSNAGRLSPKHSITDSNLGDLGQTKFLFLISKSSFPISDGISQSPAFFRDSKMFPMSRLLIRTRV